MYLTIKQHDLFRTLLMGFEIPFRKHIANVITTAYPTAEAFESAMIAKHALLNATSPQFLKSVLSDAVRNKTLKKAYAKFVTAKSSVDVIVMIDIDVPMVGALNLVTFALPEHFSDLYSLFGNYNSFCVLAEQYRYARNKLDHPGTRTLEDSHLVPVLSFVKDICNYLTEDCFLQKSKEVLLAEATALQQRKIPNPIPIHNFNEMPYGEARIVCRENEINYLKEIAYGKPDALRKPHSCCIYGYGGVGKTALVLETLKQIVCDLQDNTTVNDYQPEYVLFFSAKKRKLELANETGRIVEQNMRYHFENAEELIAQIKEALQIESFRKFHQEGIVVIDNLETLSQEERKKVKLFVETQTPAEMQFVLTSRNSEDYEINYKLGGFDSTSGIEFIQTYSDENALDISMAEAEMKQLLELAKGNTLVLVLCLRRISKRLCTLHALQTEFATSNAWRSIRTVLQTTPSNAYEVIAEFMYKDTFEHIETAFAQTKNLFHKVLKVFAVSGNNGTAHPYIKYQKARILQRIDGTEVLEEKHREEIKRSFSDAIYAIKTIEQYSGIQQTKSYASLLWIYAQQLNQQDEMQSALRYLEEAKVSFEVQKIYDEQYYQCITKLGDVYIDYYLQDRPARITYLRKAREISRTLGENRNRLGKAYTHAKALQSRLRQFGRY